MMKNQNGFTIVQALLTSTIVMILGVAVIENHSSTQKIQSRMVASVARDGASKSLYFNGSNPLSLYKSSLIDSTFRQNSPLAACICGESTCVPERATPFNLTDTSGMIIAGPSKQKIKFKNLTEYCSTPPCTFEGVANFTCQGSNCGTSTMASGNPTLLISYRLNLTPEAVLEHKEYSYLKPKTESISVSASDVFQYGTRYDLCVTGNSITPSYGLVYGGENIQLTGTGLQRVTGVLFGNQPCIITSPKVTKDGQIQNANPKAISCRNPSHAEGYVNVTLLYGNGERYVLSKQFRYFDPPPPEPPEPPPTPGESESASGSWRKGACFGPSSGQPTPTPGGSCTPGQYHHIDPCDFYCK